MQGFNEVANRVHNNLNFYKALELWRNPKTLDAIHLHFAKTKSPYPLFIILMTSPDFRKDKRLPTFIPQDRIQKNSELIIVSLYEVPTSE